MKRFNLILVVFLLCGVVAFAQHGNRKPRAVKVNPVERAERMTQRMTEELDLTADQQLKVKEINLAFCKEMQDFQHKKRALNRVCCGKDTAYLSDDARRSLQKVNRAEVKKLNKYAESLRLERKNNLEKVLTADQYKLLEQNQANRGCCCFPLKNRPARMNTAN